jgi:acyl-CoA synthetase (AMP-forming)/AMP-acid ligase II
MKHVAQTSSSGTLAERLDLWARLRPVDTALIYLDDGEHEAERWTYAELQRHAEKVAAALRGIGATGRPVLLVFPPGLAFLAAFYGCLRVGAIAVPVPSLAANRGSARLAAIAEDSRPVAMLTTSTLAVRHRSEHPPVFNAMPLIAIDELPDQAGCDHQAVSLQEVALLQYTSGSTAEPKGVAITHFALMTNLEMLQAAMQVHQRSVSVSWLPLFHDMGLIGVVLEALYAGAMIVLMPPLAFLQRPSRWLAAIDKYRGTISGAPNFAYDLCVRRVGASDRPRFDLSSWNVAFCAAEPIRAGTLQDFAEMFSADGFRAAALYPAYGLAEATVFVSGREVGAGIKTAAPTVQGEATKTAASDKQLVACGRGWHGETIAIVDPQSCRERQDGEIGEIWVSGHNIAAGYWKNPDASHATFGAKLLDRPEHEYLRTGDLGFKLEGELYVTGRLKDLLIVNGSSLHPQDVEDAVAASHPAFAATGAAFSIEGHSGEQVVAAQEVTRDAIRTDLSAAVAAAFTAVGREIGVRLFDLVLVRRGGIPLTTSGKVRRHACCELYKAGRLPVVAVKVDHPWLGKYRQ